MFFLILGPEFEACSHLGRLRDSFDKFQADLEISNSTFFFMKERLQKPDFISCPPQAALLQRVEDKIEMVKLYKGKNEENNCFVSVYDDIFCPNI